MKKIILFILLSNHIIFAKEILNVDQLILKALNLSPDLEISKAQYEASKNRYDEAFANYLPKIDLTAGTGLLGASNILSSNLDNNVNDLLILGQLSLKQIVYDFGKTRGYTQSTQVETEAYLSIYEQYLSDKKRDVKSAYYDVLKRKSLIQVNIENVKLNEAQLYRSQKYFEAGIRTKIDVTDANVELIKAKLELNDAQYKLKLAYANLDKVIGNTKSTREYSVYYKEINTSKLDLQLIKYPLNVNDSIEYSYTNRYKIKQFKHLISAAKAKEDIAISEYYPQIYLNAQYTRQIVSDSLAVFAPPTQYNAMLNLNWNLYQGGSSNAKNQEQKIRTRISQAELAFTKLEIKTEVTNAYINLERVNDSVILSKNLLHASKEKFVQAGQRYEHGLSDYIEFQQARQGYIDASAKLIINYYNYFDALAILDNAIGK